RERSTRYVVVNGRDDRGFERRPGERGQPQAAWTAELPRVPGRCPHGLPLPLAEGPREVLPRLPGLPLEARRVGASGLEQKLLPTLGVDLAQQVVDALATFGPVVPRAHAA